MKQPIPDAILHQHVAFLGKTGSGKTSTAKLAVEQIVRSNPQARVCVLDPIKSDWWGLTSSADGKRPGLPFHILGGPRGHVPLHDSAGKAIGELVATGALPLSIIDMADFSAGGLQKFFNDFAPALMKKMRGVVYLVIEEAHEFAPKERSGIGAENMAIHWAKKLATAGRSKGIRMMVLTQRTQALHNALLGSCDTMIAHRLTAPADQEPIKKWLKANVDKDIFEKVSASLSSLKTGSGWICSGEAQVADLVQFPKIGTYDNSATPTGDVDEHVVRTAAVDADRLRAIIGTAVAEAEANDPAKLKAEIARLTADARRAPPVQQPIDPSALTDATQRGFAAGFKEAQDQGAREYRDVVKEASAFFDTAAREFSESFGPRTATFTLPAIPQSGSSARNSIRVSHPVPPRAVQSPARIPSPAASGDGTLTGPQRKIVEAIHFWATVGTDWPTREQVAAVAGYSARSGSFRNTISSLNVGGFISCDQPGRLGLNGAAHALGLQEIDAPARLHSILSGPETKIVGALRGPMVELTRQQVADDVGYSADSGSFRNTLSSLHVKDVIRYPSKGTISLTHWAAQVLG